MEYAAAPANDVWGTLLKGATDIFTAREARKLAEATRATPGATIAPSNPNPFAGFWSSFPQNDTKEQYQNPQAFTLGGMGSGAMLLVVLAVVALFALLRR